MKICFVGLGSIGTRHLRNLTILLNKRGISYSIDALRSSNRPLDADIIRLLNKQFTDIENLPNDYDVAFICTPTSNHYDDIRRMANHSRHMFIEKPVFDTVRNGVVLSPRQDSIYYVACPLRYTAVLQYLKENIQADSVYAVRAICSTYLPDWRAGLDYRTVYSAHRSMGGGVEIDLIHEWDYICWLFGMPKRVQCAYGQYSDLELDSDDLALYIGEYADKIVSLHLDYFGRNERREIELYTKDETVVGDIRNGEVRFLKKASVVKLSESRDHYQIIELDHFLDILEGKCDNDNSIKHAEDVLAVAKGEWKV